MAVRIVFLNHLYLPLGLRSAIVFSLAQVVHRLSVLVSFACSLDLTGEIGNKTVQLGCQRLVWALGPGYPTRQPASVYDPHPPQNHHLFPTPSRPLNVPIGPIRCQKAKKNIFLSLLWVCMHMAPATSLPDTRNGQQLFLCAIFGSFWKPAPSLVGPLCGSHY